MPRSIFDPRGGGVDRYNEEYFARVAKEPTRRRGVNPHDPERERSAYKTRASALRRQNLRDGIADLKARERHTKLRAAHIHAAQTQKFEALREERESRQDIKLTSPTTSTSMLPPMNPLRAAKRAETEALQTKWHADRKNMTPLEFDRLRHRERNDLAKKYRNPGLRSAYALSAAGRIPDPNREVRVAAMKARVADKAERRRADRQDALHTLYMHARSFITNEAQLDAAIEDAFGTVQQPKTFGNRGVSVWANMGTDRYNSTEQPFESIADKLNKANRSRGTVQDSQGFAGITEKRLKRIAEELTGGKMDTPAKLA